MLMGKPSIFWTNSVTDVIGLGTMTGFLNGPLT
jgi:hypothetical protein